MGTGPFDEDTEQEAARLLRQLSDYTSTVVSQEIRRAQLKSERAYAHPRRRDSRLTAGGLVGLMGIATLIAAAVITLGSAVGTGLAAAAIGAALLALAAGLIVGATRRPSSASPTDGRPQL